MLVMYDDEKVFFYKMGQPGMFSGLQLIINSRLTDN